MFDKNNMVYRHESDSNETMIPVSGLLFDKETGTLFIENEYDGNYLIEPTTFDDGGLDIFCDDGLVEPLYYKKAEMLYVFLNLEDISNVKVSDKQKENFKFIDDIFCQVTKRYIWTEIFRKQKQKRNNNRRKKNRQRFL